MTEPIIIYLSETPITIVYRPRPKPEPIDWLGEMARQFGVEALVPPDSKECGECGQLIPGLGLCGSCADKKAGMR